jgi:D-glycero-alpha-D-manno-heptose 1-phosphate guanylyltransferase
LVNTAIILAGGMGTRLKSVVSELPKPMAPINGIPFLEIQIKYWISQGINNFILSVGYKKEIIINHFGFKFHTAEIKYVVEDFPLGTGGAIIKSIKQFDIKEPFMLLNGDTYFEISLFNLLSFHQNNNSQFTFSVFKSNNTERYMGLNLDHNMRLLPELFIENYNDEKYVNGGVYIINPEILNKEKFENDKFHSLENDIFPIINKKDALIYACLFENKFIDIGVPEDYYLAQKILL